LSKIHSLFQTPSSFQKEQTLLVRSGIDPQPRFLPAHLDNLDSLLDDLCNIDTVDRSLTVLTEYICAGNALVLFRDKLSGLCEALRASENSEVTIGILTFFELLVGTGEEFNIEGLGHPDHFAVILEHFPIRSAIVIATAVVRNSLFGAQTVLRCRANVDFVGMASESSLNLPEILEFLCSFSLYAEFDGFSIQVADMVLDLCFGDSCVCAFEFLIAASANRSVRCFIAFSDRFPALFDGCDGSNVAQRTGLLACVLPHLPDIAPILISGGEPILAFLRTAIASDDSPVCVDAAEVCGAIAATGPSFALRLLEEGFLDAVMGTLTLDLDFDDLSTVLVSASRFLIHTSADEQVRIARGGLFDALAGSVESLTDERLGDVLQVLAMVRARGVAEGDDWFFGLMMECAPLMKALERLGQVLTKENLRGRLMIVIGKPENEEE
jgi:hypothetical protein